MAPPLTGGSGLILVAQPKEGFMKRILFSLLATAFPFGGALPQTAPQPIVTPVMQKDLA
jgi:hypothetical protein